MITQNLAVSSLVEDKGCKQSLQFCCAGREQGFTVLLLEEDKGLNKKWRYVVGGRQRFTKKPCI